MTWKKRLIQARDAVATAITSAHTTAAPLISAAEKIVPVVTSHPAAQVVAGVFGAVGASDIWAYHNIRARFERSELGADLEHWDGIVDRVLDSLGAPKIVVKDLAVYTLAIDGVRYQIAAEQNYSGLNLCTVPGEHDIIRQFFTARIDDMYGPVVRVDTKTRTRGKSDRLVIDDYVPDARESPLARRVLDRLGRALAVVERRCILLHGRPGVGKSVAAAWLATAIARGRVVFLAPSVLDGRDAVPGLELLSPDVVVVDELDKIEVRTGVIDQLRRVARVVVFTANNGTDENHLDGSIVRCGRIDESIAVEDVGVRFAIDGIPAWIADEAAGWPTAAVAELRTRVRAYGTDPDDLLVDDIRARVAMRSMSKKGG